MGLEAIFSWSSESNSRSQLGRIDPVLENTADKLLELFGRSLTEAHRLASSRRDTGSLEITGFGGPCSGTVRQTAKASRSSIDATPEQTEKVGYSGLKMDIFWNDSMPGCITHFNP